MTQKLHIYCDLSLNHGALIFGSTDLSPSYQVVMYNYPSFTPFSVKADAIVNKMQEVLEHSTFDRISVFYEATVFGCVGPGFSQYNVFLGYLFSALKALRVSTDSEILIYSILPTKLKKHITGNGRACKLDMVRVVYDQLPKNIEVHWLGKAPKVNQHSYETYTKFDKECDLIDAYAIVLALGQNSDLFNYEQLPSIERPKV